MEASPTLAARRELQRDVGRGSYQVELSKQVQRIDDISLDVTLVRARRLYTINLTVRFNSHHSDHFDISAAATSVGVLPIRQRRQTHAAHTIRSSHLNWYLRSIVSIPGSRKRLSHKLRHNRSKSQMLEQKNMCAGKAEIRRFLRIRSRQSLSARQANLGQYTLGADHSDIGLLTSAGPSPSLLTSFLSKLSPHLRTKSILVHFTWGYLSYSCGQAQQSQNIPFTTTDQKHYHERHRQQHV